MKKQISLSIPKPCSEQWDSFSKTSNGGHCGSCNTVVTDFTKMSDEQVIAYFANLKGHTCGRFRVDQLKIYSTLPLTTVKPGMRLLKAGFVSLLMLLVSKPAISNTPAEKTKTELKVFQYRVDETVKGAEEAFVVKGVVKDESGQPMPGVNILLMGSQTGTTTDADGKFEFPEKLKEGDVLNFSFIGFAPTQYVVQKADNQNVNISIKIKMECDVIMMGAVAVDDVYHEPAKPNKKKKQ